MRGSKISALIDTDIAIDYLRGKEEAKGIVEGLWDEGKAYLSAISVYELFCGMREGEEEATDAFVEGCEVVEVDETIAREAGRLYREYRRRGVTVSGGDYIVAATALVLSVPLISNNKRHYPFEGLEVYTAREWMERGMRGS